MFENTVLDVIVGTVFTFYVVSLLASTCVEMIATMLKWRAGTLVAGIQQLVNDPKFSGLGKALYDHALINPRETDAGTPTRSGFLDNKPSYIHPEDFASAFMQTVDFFKGSASESKAAIENSPLLDKQMKDLLKGIIDETGNNLDAIKQRLADWFDAGMDRLSGAYKRRTQAWACGCAFVIALTLNVDAFQVMKTFWHQPLITKGITLSDTEQLGNSLDRIDSMNLPIGWPNGRLARDCAVTGTACIAAAGTSLAGWVLTAFAALFGAPFWFDLLQRFVSIRGTGPKPDERGKPA